MLTGVSPVIVFVFYEENPVWKKGETDRVDADGNPLIGQPITAKDWSQLSEADKWLWHMDYFLPIYLHEETIKMAVDEAEQSITVDNTTVGNLNFGSLVSNTVRLTITGTTDNVVMIALLSALSEVVKRIAKQRYAVALYFDSVLVLNGRFANISQSRIQNTNQKVVSLTIEDVPYKEQTTATDNNKPGEIENKASQSSFNPGV